MSEQRPRRIVKRSAPRAVVGDVRPRTIVKRTPGGVVPAKTVHRAGRRAPRLRLGWLIPSRRLVLGVATAGVLAAVIAGATWLWSSPVLEINSVDVEGNERIAANVIVQRAGLLGENIVTADLASAQRGIYEHPLVSKVRIERDWPNGVRIIVDERKAWGTWEQGGVRYTIDRDGVVLGAAPPTLGSPIIKASATTTLREGDRVDNQAVQAAAEIYELLPRQLGTTVTEVAFLPGKGVQVLTEDGQSALLGDSSSIAYKLSVWAAMSQQARVQGINYTTIDLRFGNRPVLQ